MTWLAHKLVLHMFHQLGPLFSLNLIYKSSCLADTSGKMCASSLDVALLQLWLKTIILANEVHAIVFGVGDRWTTVDEKSK